MSELVADGETGRICYHVVMWTSLCLFIRGSIPVSTEVNAGVGNDVSISSISAELVAAWKVDTTDHRLSYHHVGYKSHVHHIQFFQHYPEHKQCTKSEKKT